MRSNAFLTVALLSLLNACGPVLPIDDPFALPSAAKPPHSRLRIIVLDVGQGDAAIVVGPTGRTLLIDAGPEGSGSQAILPAFERREITNLDWVIASHYDADHIGGLGEVIRGPDGLAGTDDDYLPLRAILDRGTMTEKSTQAYEDYVAVAEGHRREAVPGEVIDLGDGATATVIVVNGRFADGASLHLNPDEENEASLGVLIRYGAFSYFAAGDLTGGGSPGGYETKDLETHAGELIGAIDVLHAGHHGSASSSNEAFLALTAPDTAVISVGTGNDYGHPAPETLERFENAGIPVYRTDLLGSLEIATDGGSFQVFSGD